MKIYTDDYFLKLQSKFRTSSIYRYLIILLLAFLYFAAARISMYTALAPGFATPIWPSTGIALAFLLLFGYGVWPGIVLGSFVHNILIFPTINEWHSWLVASLAGLTIGLGTALEGVTATFLIKEYIASLLPVNKVKNVFLFFAIAIGACFIAASIGVTALTFAGAIPKDQFLISWWTWWIGDAAGILVFTPLILSWVHNPKINWSFLGTFEALTNLALSAIFMYVSFTYHTPINFAFIPLAIWATFRFNLRGGTIYLATVTITMAFLTTIQPHFGGLTLIESYLLLEIFIAILTMVTLILASALNERSEAEEKLVVYNKSLEQTVEQRTQDLQKRLGQLQAMQKVISDQEKLAYLGELATGIAHDIKDPLSIINSLTSKCSDLSKSLTDSLSTPQETNKPKALLSQMDANLKSISDNSKKAIEFAQGLIYHSKDKPGYFQMVDINSLCSEYLKLASHEMYTADPWYDIQIKKDLDPSIGLISAIPQDISVVLFNMLSNANYSVHEKKKRINGDYQPKVFIRTQNMGNKIAIIIRDNGIGISEEDKEKIFTPFFSTKPMGKGIGLGLSSSHEIVVDKHEGEIKVDSKEGEYTEFKIILPRHRQIKLNEEF